MSVVGVLALQGDYEAHSKAFEKLGATAREVRVAAELDGLDGLVIPGGESTTMLKLMGYYNLFEPLARFGSQRPIFGTCAGAILLASEVINPSQPSLNLCDMTVERNAYGRQLDSRVARIEYDGGAEMEAVFIRAPIIRRVGAGGTVLSRYNGDPVLVEFERHLVATFHPELSSDLRVQQRFLAKLQTSSRTHEELNHGAR